MDASRILEHLKASPYGLLPEETLLRVADRMAPRYRTEKEALKAAKAHLHGISDAYFPIFTHKGAAMRLTQATAGPYSIDTEHALCLDMLRLHASTRERLPAMEAFYAALFDPACPVSHVDDFGSGLQAFARPWMPLASPIPYHAFDLDATAMSLVKAYLTWSGRTGTAQTWDLLAGTDPIFPTPALPGNGITLLFKLLPLLEQQRKGAAKAALAAVRTPRAAVTFPTQSLGGRGKGMIAHYTAWFEALIEGEWRVTRREVIGTELLYLIDHTQMP